MYSREEKKLVKLTLDLTSPGAAKDVAPSI